MSTLLTGVITDALSCEPDMEVFAGQNADADVVRTVRSKAIDVVIEGLRSPGVWAEAEGLFDANPRLRILGVEDDGRETTLYELRPHLARLGELSPSDLVTVIRDSPVQWRARGKTSVKSFDIRSPGSAH